MTSRISSLEPSTPLQRALPGAQFAQWHARVIEADPARVWSALHDLRLRELRVTLLLGAVRGLDVGRVRNRRVLDPPGPIAPVHQQAPSVMVSGVIGRPWKPRPEPGPAVTNLAELAAFGEQGWLKYGVQWLLSPIPGDRTFVETTTLCQATDATARRRFALYWSVIRPFSGLVRHDLLAGLARRAERGS